MWHTLDKLEVERKLKTNIRAGLKEDNVIERLKQYGENKLDEKKKENIIIKLL